MLFLFKVLPVGLVPLPLWPHISEISPLKLVEVHWNNTHVRFESWKYLDTYNPSQCLGN